MELGYAFMGLALIMGTASLLICLFVYVAYRNRTVEELYQANQDQMNELSGFTTSRRASIEEVLSINYTRRPFKAIWLDDGRNVVSVGLTIKGTYSVKLVDGRHFLVSKKFRVRYNT